MDKPNIVLIMSDQNSNEVLGCSGDEYIRTPNIDKLAESGVKFNNCYCASPLCVPSRTSLLTGQLPYKTKVMNNGHSLYSDRATIAHVVNNAGYETVLSGRMHFTGDDQNHGFEKRLVGDVTPFYHGYDFMSETFEDLYDAFLPGTPGFEKSGAGVSGIHHFDNDVVKETNEYLYSRDCKRPLFLTVGLSAPHPPYVCEKELYDYYYRILPDKKTTKEVQDNLHEALKDFIKLRKLDILNKEDLKRIRAAYYGLVEFLDRCVGEIVNSISNTLGLENTIIIYISDHGEHLGTKGMIWKGTFLESSVKVPMIISCPKKYSQGVNVDELTSLLDLTKTILDMTSAEDLPSMDGLSLLPYLEQSDFEYGTRYIISQIGTYPKNHIPSAMIRKGKYKLISYYGYKKVSLFDLDLDPKEINDLGSDSSYTELINELLCELNKNWDGKTAEEYCKEASRHYAIINKWSHTTKYEKKKNWMPKLKLNYVE